MLPIEICIIYNILRGFQCTTYNNYKTLTKAIDTILLLVG